MKHPLSYEESLALLDGMWELGMSLGVLPPKGPWESIEVDIIITLGVDIDLLNDILAIVKQCNHTYSL